MNAPIRRFATFITPHGYGHASRISSVMNAIREASPGACFEIFTRVPVWFFNMSLQDGFRYHDVLTDVGLAQATSMEEDLPETVRRLEALLPYDPALVRNLARQVKAAGCEAVLCDVAPLGIAVAREAGLPSVLVENFTWDWIYEGYVNEEPRLAPYITLLRALFASADHHIRTEPGCTNIPPADLTSNVVSRKPRSTRAETRRRLGVESDAKLVMISMGGILTQYPFLSRLENAKDVIYLVPGGSENYERRGGLVVIPHHSDLYHPDLVFASDAIVGKLGYSTLAEAYAAGIPYAYIPRARFPESPPMGAWARENIGAVEVAESEFFSGAWLDRVPDLLAQPRRVPEGPNGADQIAAYVLGL